MILFPLCFDSSTWSLGNAFNLKFLGLFFSAKKMSTVSTLQISPKMSAIFCGRAMQEESVHVGTGACRGSKGGGEYRKYLRK